MSGLSLSSRPADRLGLTLLLATAVHAALILGLRFDPDLVRSPRAEQSLQIRVVRHLREPHKPEKVDFLAQASQQGGGTQEAAQMPTTQPSRPPTHLAEQAFREIRPSGAPRPSRTIRRVITAIDAPRQVASAPLSPPSPAAQRPSVAELLSQRSQEIERITAELDRRTQAYAKRPRRKFISASTREVKYAFYQEAWRQKVERIGTLNYPEDAKRGGLYGTLVLHCAVRADGTVESIDIQRSSGIKVLDDAATRAVRLSAPFAPFPPDIAAETDILDITRTFKYTSDNAVTSD